MVIDCRISIFVLLGLLTLKFVYGISAVDSEFYQPGRGVILESWVSSVSYGIDEFDKINKYPVCPAHGVNMDSFSDDVDVIAGSYKYNCYSSFFVSPQNGIHEFFMICDFICRLEIEIVPFGVKKILLVKHSTENSWMHRKWADKVTLQKGFRYLIKAYQIGDGLNRGFLRLGVKFPDGSEVKPIDNRFLWRSMVLYQWNGVLVQRYDDIKFPSDRSVSRFYNENFAKYPSMPSAYYCSSSLYGKFSNHGDNLALMYIGYIRLPENSDYTFQVEGNEIGEFAVTKSNAETNIVNFDALSHQSSLSGGRFINTTYYQVRATLVEKTGGDFLKIMYKSVTGTYTRVSGKLRNLKVGDTKLILPTPVCKMINASVISATLSDPPTLPKKDSWTFTNKFDIVAFETSSGEAAKVIKLGSSGLPKTHNFTGLKNYTDYSFYVQYYGLMNNSIEYNIISSTETRKTGENVPSAPPANIQGFNTSSTSIGISWEDVPNGHRNGIITGYNVQIRKYPAGEWHTYKVKSKYHEVAGLMIWSIYNIKISAETAMGDGVTSDNIQVKTDEGVPASHPEDFKAKMTGPTDAKLFWKQIPAEYQKGIITYKIFYRIAGEQTWIKAESSGSSMEINSLEFRTEYELKICGATRKGTGPCNSATLSTDTYVYENMIVKDTPRAFTTSIEFTDRALRRHISKIIRISSIEECFKSCKGCLRETGDCKCASLNIQREIKGEKRVCEINSESKETFPNDFIHQQGYQYYNAL